jgi:quercetin dioxygenase-like cupin family protein
MRVKSSASVRGNAVVASDGTVCQVLIGPKEAPNFLMRKFTVQPGGKMTKHTNTVEHEQYVLRGKGWIGMGDDVVEVKAGDVIFVPAGTPHWCEAHPAQSLEFLCMVPNSEDQVEILG